MCVCVFALRIVSGDNILRFINTLINYFIISISIKMCMLLTAFDLAAFAVDFVVSEAVVQPFTDDYLLRQKTTCEFSGKHLFPATKQHLNDSKTVKNET